jgi:hypothetical protein
VRRTRLGKLPSRPLEQLFKELNNDSNKLLKLLRRVRREASRQAQKIEQLRSLRVVHRLQMLLQLYYHLSHDTAKQLSFCQNINRYIYQSRHIELTPRRYRNDSYCMWLNSLKFGVHFGVQSAHYTGHYIVEIGLTSAREHALLVVKIIRAKEAKVLISRNS